MNGSIFPGASASVQDPKIYLHALRRRWLMILGIGLLIAAPASAAVWFLLGEQYEATATLQVAIAERAVAFEAENMSSDSSRFDIFKNTQRQMILSRFVLSSALQKPEVTRIPAVRKEVRKGDPVEWLAYWLNVGFPGGAEVMTVSLSMRDPEHAQTLVKAVVDSYMVEYVNAERDRKRKRLDELKLICAAKDGEIRKNRETLKSYGQEVGSMDAMTLNSRQRIMFDELSLNSRQLAESKAKATGLEAELAAWEAILKNIEESEVPAVEVDQLIQLDPMARELGMELSFKKMDAAYASGRVVEGAQNKYVGRHSKEAQALQERYDARVAELMEKAREKKRHEAEIEILRFKTLLSTAREQQEEWAAKVTEMRAEAEKFGIVSVDIQMRIADLKRQEMLATELTSERDKLDVELNAPQRITQLGAVEKPRVPSNTVLRAVLAIMTALGGLAIPAIAIAFFDAQAGRINTSDDVSKKLHVPVIGSVPRIPTQVINRMSSPSKRHRSWHLRLTESVDGIAARLLRYADTKQDHVIMVSSATGGEGKTTLATQLALSLARTGRSTVLVDFDLRRPSFDEVFGVPLAPGIAELLRGQNTTADLMHESAAENLSVITAGQWDRQALAALSNGSASALFKELRADFDFVVVDTSPILPVADARFVSQLVDSVVLSIFRDVSQAPKIQAACEILTAFGVKSVEAVVTGLNQNAYGRHMGYESTVNA